MNVRNLLTNAIEHAPHGFERRAASFQQQMVVLLRSGMALNQLCDGAGMMEVRLTMNGEELHAVFIRDAVETFEPFDFNGRDFRHLRLINVERGKS